MHSSDCISIFCAWIDIWYRYLWSPEVIMFCPFLRCRGSVQSSRPWTEDVSVVSFSHTSSDFLKRIVSWQLHIKTNRGHWGRHCSYTKHNINLWYVLHISHFNPHFSTCCNVCLEYQTEEFIFIQEFMILKIWSFATLFWHALCPHPSLQPQDSLHFPSSHFHHPLSADRLLLTAWCCLQPVWWFEAEEERHHLK